MFGIVVFKAGTQHEQKAGVFRGHEEPYLTSAEDARWG